MFSMLAKFSCTLINIQSNVSILIFDIKIRRFALPTTQSLDCSSSSDCSWQVLRWPFNPSFPPLHRSIFFLERGGRGPWGEPQFLKLWNFSLENFEGGESLLDLLLFLVSACQVLRHGRGTSSGNTRLSPIKRQLKTLCQNGLTQFNGVLVGTVVISLWPVLAGLHISIVIS